MPTSPIFRRSNRHAASAGTDPEKKDIHNSIVGMGVIIIVHPYPDGVCMDSLQRVRTRGPGHWQAAPERKRRIPLVNCYINPIAAVCCPGPTRPTRKRPRLDDRYVIRTSRLGDGYHSNGEGCEHRFDPHELLTHDGARGLAVDLDQPTSVGESGLRYIRPLASGGARCPGSPLAIAGRSDWLTLKERWQARHS
jgi:hypothetical protein